MVSQNLVDYLVGFSASFVLWGVYLERNPLIGGIFFRPGADNSLQFRWRGIIPMITYPFQTTHFWYPWNWDLNWIVVTQFGAVSYLVLKNMDEIRDYLFANK